MLLPAMLVVAAVMSQFSAAVADTVGAGGLLEEETRHRISTRLAYPLIAFCAIMLVWNAHIFHMIAFASRTFAAYYFLQALVAFQVTLRCPDLHHRRAWQLMFGTRLPDDRGWWQFVIHRFCCRRSFDGAIWGSLQFFRTFEVELGNPVGIFSEYLDTLFD